MKKIALAVRIAQRYIYASLPVELRALSAIHRIATIKVAYSKSDINQMVNSLMIKEGVVKRLSAQGLELPDIDYGTLFMVAINTFTRRHRLSPQQREDYLNDLVSDMIMGKSLTTLKDSPDWKHNLMGYVESFVNRGWNEQRISATLVKMFGNKLVNIAKREVSQRGPATVGLMQSAPSSELNDGGLRRNQMYEDLFTMDGLTRAQMGGYQSMFRTNPEAKQLVEQIRKTLDRRNDAMGLIWSAYMKNPSASVPELLLEEVKVNTPEFRGKLPLWEAMGYPDPVTKRTNLNYEIKKMKAFLERAWPDIKDIVIDMDRD